MGPSVRPSDQETGGGLTQCATKGAQLYLIGFQCENTQAIKSQTYNAPYMQSVMNTLIYD